MSKRTQGYILIVLSALIFGSNETALKGVTGVFAPMQITALRFFLGGLLLMPVGFRSLKKKGLKLDKKDLPGIILNGVFLVCVGMVVHQLAIGHTKAAIVSLITCTNTLFVTFLAHFLLKEAIHLNHIVALVLELLAVAVMIDLFTSRPDPAGTLLSLGASLSFAIYTTLGRKYSLKYGGGAVTCIGLFSGAVALILILLLGRTEAAGGFFQSIGMDFLVNVPLIMKVPGYAIPGFLYNVIVITAAANFMQMVSIEYTSAQEASIMYFLKPVFAPIFAYIFLHEEITKSMLLGILIFLTGSAISVLPGFIKELKAHKKGQSQSA